MPIEIRELIIKATVSDESSSPKEKNVQKNNEQIDDILAIIAQEISRNRKNQGER